MDGDYRMCEEKDIKPEILTPHTPMDKTSITVFHGSEFIIESPEFNKGNKHNDYGMGFYTTRYNYRVESGRCILLICGGFYAGLVVVGKLTKSYEIR